MRWLLPLLLASVATLLASVATAPAGAPKWPDPADVTPLPSDPAPRVFCEHPQTLQLRRFEDRSARLECGGRVLVRVSVPG